MGVTIIGDTDTSSTVRALVVPTVEVKATWAAAWTYRPDLEFIGGSFAAEAQDMGRVEVQRRYGVKKEPYESAFVTEPPLRLQRYWLRVRFVGAQGSFTDWVGLIENDRRDIYGDASARSGMQTWVAYSPRILLMRVHVSHSFWFAQASRMGWTPDFNSRDTNGRLVGNRTSATSGTPPSYMFGGQDTWTRKQILDYLIARFMDRAAYGGPTWTVGGQVNLLNDVSDTIPVPEGSTAYGLVRGVVDPAMGVDFKIVPHEDGTGFVIHVFSLVNEPESFGGVTLPNNPDTVEVVSSQSPNNIRTTIVESNDQQYDTIRVYGERIVVAKTLFGTDLQGKWSAALEAEYRAGSPTPGAVAEEHDTFRGDEKFRNVFQAFGAPVNWDTTVDSEDISPYVGYDGQLLPFGDNYQLKVRDTLSWLPLKEGFDHTVSPAMDQTLAGTEPSFLPPMVFVYDFLLNRWMRGEDLGIGAETLEGEWGLRLSSSPNHLLALNDWDGVANVSEFQPLFNWREELALTIAWRTDQRLRMTYENYTAGVDIPPDQIGNTLDIFVPGAELWVVAKNTAVSIGDSGSLLTVPRRTELRNDSTRLAMVMAGAIARYVRPRFRAEIEMAGYQPWGGLVGQILTVVDEDGDAHKISAPITEVVWLSGARPRTIVRTGYAS